MELQRLSVFGGIDLLHSRIKAFRYAPHWHDDYVIAFYRSGRKHFRCGRQEGFASGGDILIIAPGTVHSAASFEGVGWDYRSLYISEEQIAATTGVEKSVLAQKVHDHRHLRDQFNLVRSLGDVLDAGTSVELALSEWLLGFFGRLDAAPHRTAKNPSGLDRIFERLLDLPRQSPSLGELALEAGLSPEHLSRAFRTRYGVSPFQLLTAARVCAARRAIASGTPLATAALEAGFTDQSHMTRWMKRAFGVTPGVLANYQ